MIGRSLSLELNRLRWIAALLVMLSHLRNLMFVEYGELAHASIPLKLLYFVTGFGHEAVVVFFVISGLLVGGVSIDKLRGERFDPVDFAIHRFTRIYIVLVPALLACLLLDRVGIAWFDHAGLYTRASQANYFRIFADHLDWTTLLGNLAMQQHMRVDVLGSDAPLWSLSYEWWYYMLFFVAALGMVFRRRPPVLLLCAGALVLMGWWLPLEPLLWFSLWLLGAALAFAPMRRVRLHPLAAYAVFAAILVWSRFDHTYTTSPSMLVNFRRDAAVALGCFLLFAALAGRDRKAGPGARLHRAMAEFSYTVYLVHVPFLVFAVAFLDTVFAVPVHAQPTTAGMLLFVGLLAATYVYCHAFSLLTERHTDRLRRRLRKFATSFAARRASSARPEPLMPMGTADD